MIPENMSLWHIILSYGNLKNSKCRKRFSLNPLSLPKDRSSRRNLVIKNRLFQGVSSTREFWLLLQERRGEVDMTPGQTVSQIIPSHICSSKDPFIFPKNHLLSPKRHKSHSLSLLWWYLILNSRSPHFFLGLSHVYMKYPC